MKPPPEGAHASVAEGRFRSHQADSTSHILSKQTSKDRRCARTLSLGMKGCFPNQLLQVHGALPPVSSPAREINAWDLHCSHRGLPSTPKEISVTEELLEEGTRVGSRKAQLQITRVPALNGCFSKPGVHVPSCRAHLRCLTSRHQLNHGNQ